MPPSWSRSMSALSTATQEEALSSLTAAMWEKRSKKLSSIDPSHLCSESKWKVLATRDWSRKALPHSKNDQQSTYSYPLRNLQAPCSVRERATITSTWAPKKCRMDTFLKSALRSTASIRKCPTVTSTWLPKARRNLASIVDWSQSRWCRSAGSPALSRKFHLSIYRMSTLSLKTLRRADSLHPSTLSAAICTCFSKTMRSEIIQNWSILHALAFRIVRN